MAPDPARTPTPALAAEDLDLATLLSLAGTAADRYVMDAMAERGYAVTRAHGYVFQRLLTGALTISSLAADLGITQQGASQHVAEMERLGLVSRSVDPADRRARTVMLTERGRAAIDAARQARTAFTDRIGAMVDAASEAGARRLLLAVLDDAGVSRDVPGRRIPLETPPATSTT